jgi:hypothetical protein
VSPQTEKTTFWARAGKFVRSFRRFEGLELPDEGRSSKEDNLNTQLGAALSQFAGLPPEIPFSYLDLLEQLRIWHPLVNQFAENVINLGNTGHQLVVDAANDQQAEKAVMRLNETAPRLWEEGAGVDGLINRYLDDIAIFGALSSEDVVNFGARRVEKVVIVPVKQIRFTYDGNRYLPHQQPRGLVRGATNAGTMIPLNLETYRYYKLESVGNSPYAKPLITAALEDITGPLADGKENLRAVLRKYGLLGFGVLSVGTKRQKDGESDEEYQTRMKGYLKRCIEAVQGSLIKGMVGLFREHKLDFHSVTAEARGVKDIFEIIEGQVFNGTGTMPAFFGRVHSTTETFADVLYSVLDAQVSNIRRLPKRRMERTYTLDLLLGGLQFNGVAVKFNGTPSRNRQQDATAKQIETQIVLEKAKSGIIGPDQAAQELGYDSAFDPTLLSAQPAVAAQLQRLRGADAQSFVAMFRFDRSLQRYVYQAPPVVSLSSVGADDLGSNVVRLKKKTG